MIRSDRVRALLEQRALSQSELARRVGVTQGAIAKIVSNNPGGSSKLHRIARELGTTPAYLTGETDDLTADAPPEPELSADERAWVAYWRALDREGRDVCVRVVRRFTRCPAPERSELREHN